MDSTVLGARVMVNEDASSSPHRGWIGLINDFITLETGRRVYYIQLDGDASQARVNPQRWWFPQENVRFLNAIEAFAYEVELAKGDSDGKA